MKIFHVGLLLVLTSPIFAQIGVGTTTPNTSSVLDVSSSNRGFLLPRVALTSNTDVTTVASPIKGLIVYNKGTGGLAQEGVYVWNGFFWKPFVYETGNSFGGDVSGRPGVNQVVGIRGKSVVFASPSTTQLLRFNGTNWVNSDDVSSQNWLMTGNVSTTGSNYLGTVDDTKMTLKSFNESFFEFGKRQTLGLTQGYTDYTDNNQFVTHLLSAMQFEASGAGSYKPMFFVDSNGNFRLKGSMAGNDYFEIGAAGVSNDGSFEFIVGDEGEEPIVFEKYNNSTSVEMLRMQGTGNNSEVRVGINTNTVVANSVFQINGSVSKSITSVSANLSLTDLHHTVVFTGGDSTVTATLPAANLVSGRIYVIRNTSGSTKNISSYVDQFGATVATIANNSVVWLQSDGTNWISI
jgi:hypothetical protein